MKKLYRLFFVLFLLLPGVIGFSQAVQPVSELTPCRAITDSRPMVHAEVMDDDSWCEVVWGWYPNWELAHDDGEADDYFIYQNPGSLNANKFFPPGYPFIVNGGRIYVGDGSFPGPFLGTSFQVLVYDDDGEDGLPGTALDSLTVTVNNYEWVEFEGMTASITQGDFYLAMKQTAPAPNAAPVGVDLDNPTYFRSYSYFVGAPGWVLSPLQDFMIRAWIIYDEQSRDIDYYQLDRFSDFDPNGSPHLGDTTLLDTTSHVYYNDTNWVDLEEGYYAYGLKTHYTSGEWSDYDISNIVAHLLNMDLTIHVDLCDTTWPELTEVTLEGSGYPYRTYSLDGSGPLLFEDIFEGYYTITATSPGNSVYVLENVCLNNDSTINISMLCPHYPARNASADPVTLQASWDPPQVVVLDVDFEQDGFPPPGWQALSEGEGWFRTTDGSGAGWNIPGWNSYYACTNDLLAGDNNGSMDFLITPVLDLRYTYNFTLSFYSYFDGSNGQEAFAKFNVDGDPSWDIYYQMEPSTSWEHIELDLFFSGPESEPVWLAFHADDNGLEASGWAIDSIRVYSPDPPASLIDYYVYLDDSLIAITDTTSINLPVLTYGQAYTLCVKSHYPSGLSQPECATFTSYYLYPPSCFYQADTGNLPLIICPPLDSTGAIPDNFLGYNLYRDGSFVEFLPPSTTSYDPNWPLPCMSDYGLTAVYDLTDYGFPGETGESMAWLTEYILRYGFPLDFLEPWNFGTFETNNWTIDGPNWSVNGQTGHPAPSAEFSWDPVQTDYSISLESYPFLADSMIEGQIYLDFDIKLDDIIASGSEFLSVQVWNWESQEWATAETFSNDEGSFSWISEHLDITDYAMNQVFKIRFAAQGENSVDILSWFIDNIHVYRTCYPPINLISEWLEHNFILELTWENPTGVEPQDQWIHWDDGLSTGISIGIPTILEFDVAARWNPTQLAALEGGSVTGIAFFPAETTATYHVRVWEGPNAANLLADQVVVLGPEADQWTFVQLDTAVPININEELWVGYHIGAAYGYPAGTDDGPAIEGFGNMINTGEGWQTLTQIMPALDYNWHIAANVQWINDGNQNSRDFVKYAIYRSDDGNPYFLRDFSEQNYYLDDSVCYESGNLSHDYKLTAIYSTGDDACESGFSNVAGDICEGIKDNNEVSTISIYPNPASEVLFIESSEEIKSVRILDSRGGTLELWNPGTMEHWNSGTLELWNGGRVEIPVIGLTPGLYLVRVETEGAVVARKVVVMH